MRFPDTKLTAREWARYIHEYGQRFVARKFDGTGLEVLRHSLGLAERSPKFALTPAPAVEFFGLRKPVEVNIVPFGTYRLSGAMGSIDLKDTVYEVFIASQLEPKLASAVLWHELTHAAQMESGGTQFFANYWKEYDMRTREGYSWESYAEISFEREAYENMNNHFTQPLTCPV